MKILGINFGHDASLALFESGALIQFEELERASRIKHQYGIISDSIKSFLNRCKTNFSEINFVALCGTQGWAMPHDENIKIQFNNPQLNVGPQRYMQGRGLGGSFYENHLLKQDIRFGTVSLAGVSYKNLTFNGVSAKSQDLHDISQKISHLDKALVRDFSREFLIGGDITIHGITKPSYYVDHHFAHANYAYYYSDKLDSFISTHDGGLPEHPFMSGGVYYTTKFGICPIIDHRLGLGYIYDQVASYVNVGDAGKLMGLSSYAVPDSEVIEISTEYLSKASYGWDPIFYKEIFFKLIRLSQLRQNPRLNEIEKFCLKIPIADIQLAANVQYFFEIVFLESIGKFCSGIAENLRERKDLYLTGGTTLNCPTNSRLRDFYKNLFIKPLPACGDTGLSIGAAFAVQIDQVGEVQIHGDENRSAAFPPLHINSSCDVDNGLYGLSRLAINEDIPTFLARALCDEKIVCVFRGRSEVGPRALGNRSIIALANNGLIRDKINFSKGRENWRPLAPICRDIDFSTYFEGDPRDYKYMLFTANVKTSFLPGITHVDGSARVQVITDDDLWLYPALEIIKRNGVPPVIINTSFNCAGEPIVESLGDALKSFQKMNFDYLVTDDGIYCRNYS